MTRSPKAVIPSADRRSEFVQFYRRSSTTIVAELFALTGDLEVARGVGAASFSRAWQAWPAIRSLPDPVMWVRADAVQKAFAPARGIRLLQHGLPPARPVALDTEDEVVVAALQRLPREQRLPLVLHYMAGLPVPTVAELARCSVGQVERILDDGFDRLVELLDWPAVTAALGGPDDRGDPDEEYEWTADVLQDSAYRLPKHVSPSSPAVVFRRAAVTRWTKRGAPVSAAAAACVGIIASLAIPAEPPTQSAVFGSGAGAGGDVFDAVGPQEPNAQPALMPAGPNAPIRGITVAQIRNQPAFLPAQAVAEALAAADQAAGRPAAGPATAGAAAGAVAGRAPRVAAPVAAAGAPAAATTSPAGTTTSAPGTTSPGTTSSSPGTTFPGTTTTGSTTTTTPAPDPTTTTSPTTSDDPTSTTAPPTTSDDPTTTTTPPTTSEQETTTTPPTTTESSPTTQTSTETTTEETTETSTEETTEASETSSADETTADEESESDDAN